MEHTNNILEFSKCNYLNPMKDNANKMLNKCINNVNVKCNNNCNPNNLLTFEYIMDNTNIINTLNDREYKDNNDEINLVNDLSNFEGFVVNQDMNLDPSPTDNYFKLNTSAKDEYILFKNNQGYLYDNTNDEYIKVVNNGVLGLKDNRPEPFEDVCYPNNYAGINNQGNILCDLGNNTQTELYNLKNILQPNFIPPSLR